MDLNGNKCCDNLFALHNLLFDDKHTKTYGET